MDISTFRRGTVPLAIAAFAALTALPLPSLAASASASLTGISLSVFDLDPNDGVTAAGFSFVQGASSVRAFMRAENAVPLTDLQDVSQSGLDSPFIALSGSASVTGAQVSGAATPNSLATAGSTSAEGTAFRGFLRSSGDLVFNPFTRLVVRADYSLAASALDACVAGGCDQGVAQVAIGSFGDSTELVQSREAMVSAVAQPGGGVINTSPASGSLVMTLDVGQFGGSTELTFFAQSFGLAAPIPEPETYALMLLGLGVLGIAARRRHRR